jgi:penicillin amidase
VTDERTRGQSIVRIRQLPRAFSGTVAACALGGALWVGFKPVGALPALGTLLDPARGVWAAARVAELPATQQLSLEGLSAPVEVRYDRRGVPHIFAKNSVDLARALGWVHARDRLFQMELTARKVAGTLSELAGQQTLPVDRQSRERGLALAAKARWDALPKDAPTRVEAIAYFEGVNAYVRSLRPEEIPVEYKLLGATPRTFEDHEGYSLLAEMAQVLSWQSEELQRGAIEAMIGREATDALFPVNSPIQEPIEPVAGRTAPRFAPMRFPAPSVPDAKALAAAKRAERAHVRVALGPDLRARDPELVRGAPQSFTRGDAVVGSNNWAVAPARSASGRALLSGDPHLGLSLPSVWYEVHLVIERELDVYGVTFPLAPVIPIGFNRDVAWTATNSGADVTDFYREVVDDSISPKKYQVDGEWRALTLREEVYRGKSGEVLATDTLRRTHRGPLLSTPEGWLSLRWTALEPSDEASALRSAMRATDAAGWYRAMESYRSPAQNFLVADRAGTIGIRATGRFPIRPGDGRGDRIFDGSTAKSDWIGDWPLAEYPQSLAPAQGYLASNNQQPLDPSVRPRYLGWDWPTPWRAMRINEILRADAGMTPDKMRLAHTDPKSVLTDMVRSALRAAAVARADLMDADANAALAYLEQWNGSFAPEEKGPVLFDALLNELQRRTWDEFAIPGENRRVASPSTMMLARLFEDAGSVWWDDRSTPGTVESRDQLLIESLKESWRATRTRRGNDPAQWKWSDVRQASIRHLLQLPGFSRDGLSVQSGPGTLSPNEGRGTFGASWRFVVELGDDVNAWGTYPGGQSGNPVSSRYADRVEQWRTGQLAPLLMPRMSAELGPEKLMSALTLSPAGGVR